MSSVFCDKGYREEMRGVGKKGGARCALKLMSASGEICDGDEGAERSIKWWG